MSPLRYQDDTARLKALREAATEVLSPCDFGDQPAPSEHWLEKSRRRWCLNHHEWDYLHIPCPFAVLRAVLDHLDDGE